MNYLFYLGIIIPTLITIVLFLVFIYCWFLQKARKEVLTKRYDPHGKMRRLGIPMDPPSPPPYCRIGSDLFSDSGEDNEAYDVSRSPSTEQNIRGRPMYRTYHDSGISAGLSPTLENDPRPPGLAYRSCPDSGISGFGMQTVQTSACVHHTCRGCCQDGGESIQMQQMHQHHQQQQQQQQQQQVLHQNQQFQQHIQQQQYPQQEQHIPPQNNQIILHHNTIQASVHPNHGVCYGDDTAHPQSPQHYNPPPFHQHTHFQAVEMGAVGGGGGGGSMRHLPPSNVNILPHIQEQPASCVLQRTGTCCSNHTSPEHLQQQQNMSSYPPPPPPPQPPTSQPPPPPQQQQPSLSSPQHHNQACCHCQNQPYHQHHHHHHQQQQLSPEDHGDNMPSLSQPCSSSIPSYNNHNNNNNPRGELSNMASPTDVQAHYVNREGGLPAVDPSSFKPKPFHAHPKDTKNLKNSPGGVEYPPPPPYQQAPSTSISSPSYPSTSTMHSYRGGGIGEMAGPIAHTTTLSDRPDSQASASSTTDSEDSGFRSSHNVVQHNNTNNPTANNNTTLNKHGNPLLKPLRRPRNSAKVKSSKSGNSDGNSSRNKKVHANNASATPLTTLNPQNLSSQHNELSNDVIQTTALMDRGDNTVTNNRAPPRVLHLNGPNNNSSNMSPSHGVQRALAQQSPVREKDWSMMTPTNETDSKAKRSQLQHQHQQQQQQQQHFDMTDISTHLSWKYLQDMSAASSKSAGSDGSSSSTDDSHRVVSPLLRHAQPEQTVDMFSYSVV